MYLVENKNKTLYILVSGGDIVFWSTDKKEVLFEAYDTANYRINDFLKHKLPLKLSESEKEDFDLYLYEINKEQKVELPFQEWVDEYYHEMRLEEKRKPYKEYMRYLELKEVWEGKEPPEKP